MTSVLDRPASGPGSPPPDQERLSPGWFLALILGAVGILVAGFIALAVGAIALSDRGGSGDGSAGSAPIFTTVDVVATEFSFSGNLVARAGNVTLRLTNNGSQVHNIGVKELGLISTDVLGGGVVELDLGVLEAGEYTVYCNIAGHESSGMVATLTVTNDPLPEGEVSSGAVSGTHGGHTDEEYQAMNEAMIASLVGFGDPDLTQGRGNQVIEPTEVRADGTKVFDIVAEITPWEVEPGKIVDAWTYNGMVPGPQFQLDRGDKVEVRVVNNLPVFTDIHWHGVVVPFDQDGVAPITQEPIAANGGTHTYAFTVNDDAVAMYHAHAHGHIAMLNGMFGTIMVGENPIPYGQTISGYTVPEDVDPALEITMVVNDAGVIGLSLNGKSFPATELFSVNQGDWVTVHYFNEGLQVHPMHLHRFAQLVYAKDGFPLDQPYWVDTLNVAPGERYSLLFRADDPGLWVWHCHILNHVERTDGMFGMVAALDVKENPAFDPQADPIQPTNWRNVVGGASLGTLANSAANNDSDDS